MAADSREVGKVCARCLVCLQNCNWTKGQIQCAKVKPCVRALWQVWSQVLTPSDTESWNECLKCSSHFTVILQVQCILAPHTGKDHNTVYATPCYQDARHTTSSLPAHEDEDTDGTANSVLSSTAAQHQDMSRDHRDGAFSSVTQPVDLFYSTVSFTKQTDSSTATLRPAEVTYSTIAEMSKNESAVYCNVWTQAQQQRTLYSLLIYSMSSLL